jgi:membrane-anchored protein YejM (alkaline phosphatase superfamily)
MEDTYLKETKGHMLHQAQISAVEHLDTIMGDFFSRLTKNTFVIITADHGEAFGEDGFWGHGIYHPTVMNVPMMCFMLNGEEPLSD